MSASATNLQYDCTGLSISYGPGPTVVALTQSVKVSFVRKNKLEHWQPGGARFATVLVTGESERGITIQGGDIAKQVVIPSDTACTITGVLPDARNGGSGTGSITFTLANAILDDGSVDATARKFAMGGISFTSFSSDGNTDPLTFVVTP